ncbi:response to high light intensity [Fragilaria crotonensis]|nr:response to high light intensity [Fragilaria crotonensis]
MHPYSVSGFVGLLTNALALLPLGHTDGGRITLAMFGRRGAYLIKTFAGIALCFLGLVGLDESRILISYTAFVYLCQRELEAPMLNEVDQVDDGRAVIGFLTGILVTLVLLPMPQ